MAKNSPDEGKNIKMVEKQAAEASMINLDVYKRQWYGRPTMVGVHSVADSQPASLYSCSGFPKMHYG